MFQHQSTRRALLAAAMTVGFIVPIAAQAGGHAPGHAQAVLAIKDPAHYGPHLAATDQPSHARGHSPMPGSPAAILSVKDPQHYGPQLAYVSNCAEEVPTDFSRGVQCTARRISDIAAEKSEQVGTALRPGSWDAIMSVKDPFHFQLRSRKAGL